MSLLEPVRVKVRLRRVLPLGLGQRLEFGLWLGLGLGLGPELTLLWGRVDLGLRSLEISRSNT